MTAPPPRPRAFRLDDVAFDRPAAEPRQAEVRLTPEPIAETPPLDAPEREIEAAQAAGVARRRRLSFVNLAWAGFGGLVSLGVALWIDQLVEALWRRASAFGGLGLAFLALFLVGLAGLAAREIAALARQRRIADLHAALAAAHAADDRAQARTAVRRLVALYAGRPRVARACAEVLQACGEIIDGRDLVELAERALVKPLDARARAEVAAAVRRVSLVTALSPRAILDVLFVAAAGVRLVRRIAEIYGGRPGLLGFLRLARSISAHLVITGGMAAGDTALQSLIGHGLAAKLSSRMGEGVLNGLLTARVGLSALAVCRPAPFHAVAAPGVHDVAPFLFVRGKTREL